MRIVKTGDKKAAAAHKALDREDAVDQRENRLAKRRIKAQEAIEDAGLGDNLAKIMKPNAKLTPMLQKARVIYAKTVYGQALTPMFFKAAVADYFKDIDERQTVFVTPSAKSLELPNRRPYLVEGLCDRVGIDKSLFTRWANDTSYGELHTIARMAMQKIAARLLDLGLMKELDSAMTKFYLKNITDLKECMGDKDGVKIGNVTFVTVKDRDEYRRLKAADEGPVIDVEVEQDDAKGNDKSAV